MLELLRGGIGRRPAAGVRRARDPKTQAENLDDLLVFWDLLFADRAKRGPMPALEPGGGLVSPFSLLLSVFLRVRRVFES